MLGKGLADWWEESCGNARDPALWLRVEALEVLALWLRVADGDKVVSTHEPRDTPGGRITRGSNVPLPMERESIVRVMGVYRGSSCPPVLLRRFWKVLFPVSC